LYSQAVGISAKKSEAAVSTLISLDAKAGGGIGTRSEQEAMS